MRYSNEIKIVLVVFFLLLFAVVITSAWHSFAQRPAFVEMRLLEFDAKIPENGASCFSLELNPQNYASEKLELLSVIANNKVFKQTLIDVSKKHSIKECISAKDLNFGDNIVIISLADDRVFYHVEKMLVIEKKQAIIEIRSVDEKSVSFSIENNDLTRFQAAEILVNDKLDHRVYPIKEKQYFNEKILLQDGLNKVKIAFKNAIAEASIEKKSELKTPFILGLILLTALLSVFFFFVFSKHEMLERTALSIAAFFAVLSLLPYILLQARIFSIELFLFLIAIIILALVFFFKKNFKETEIKLRMPSAFELLLIAFILFSSLFFQLFTENHVSLWTSFYERQSSFIAKEKMLPFNDPFSELGEKPFAYMSSYFFINASMQWLLSMKSKDIFAVILLLGSFLLLLSMLLLFKALKVERKNAYLATMLLFMTGFFIGDITFNIRHALGFSFMILSFFFLIEKKEKIIPALFLALAAFIQLPLLLIFIILAIVLVKQKELKNALKEFMIALVLVFIAFMPVFFSHGFLREAKADIWGYNFGMPYYGMIIDLFSVLLFIALAIIPLITAKKISLNSENKKILLAVIILLVIQAFITYRVNIATALLLAVFIAKVFPERYLKQEFVEHSLSIALILGLGIAFMTMTFYATPSSELAIASFIKENTSSNANFLNEPALGHSMIFLAERKMLSDLEVEYANARKIDDSYEFLKTGNKEILKKYDIDYVINRAIFIEEKPVGSNFYFKKIEFESLNKVYSNNAFYLHLRRFYNES